MKPYSKRPEYKDNKWTTFCDGRYNVGRILRGETITWNDVSYTNNQEVNQRGTVVVKKGITTFIISNL
jgi:hypothetical protein